LPSTIYNNNIKNFKFKEKWIKAIMGGVKKYIKKIIRFKDVKERN
jgi:hypothetical protein